MAKQVKKFIEEEIVGKTFEFHRIFDAGYNVRGTYKEKTFNIPNNIGYGEEPGLYNKADNLIKSLKGGI